MMQVLVHHIEPGTAPVGVWWLPKHRSVPQAKYLDETRYTDGARYVLGTTFDGTPFTLAQWLNKVESLTESANPFITWAWDETDNPTSLLSPTAT